MEELRTPQGYFRFVNRIFKIIDNPNDWKNVELSVDYNISFKDYLMLYYNTIETNIQKVIPFHFYKTILQTLPLFPHKNGYIYKCDHCGFFMVLNPAIRKNNVSKWVKTPLLYGFYDQNMLNNYINYYIQNYDNVTRITREIENIDIETHNLALFHEYHNKYANNKCTDISINRFKGFTDSYHPHHLLERVCVLNHTKNPITQYINLISHIFPYLTNTRYTPNQIDIRDIHRLSQLYLSKKVSTDIRNIAVVFAVITLLVTNKLITKEKLTEKLSVKHDRYPFMTLREVSNIFGISYNTILRGIKPIITTILNSSDFLS